MSSVRIGIRNLARRVIIKLSSCLSWPTYIYPKIRLDVLYSRFSKKCGGCSYSNRARRANIYLGQTMYVFRRYFRIGAQNPPSPLRKYYPVSPVVPPTICCKSDRCPECIRAISVTCGDRELRCRRIYWQCDCNYGRWWLFTRHGGGHLS